MPGSPATRAETTYTTTNESRAVDSIFGDALSLTRDTYETGEIGTTNVQLPWITTFLDDVLPRRSASQAETYTDPPAANAASNQRVEEVPPDDFEWFGSGNGDQMAHEIASAFASPSGVTSMSASPHELAEPQVPLEELNSSMHALVAALSSRAPTPERSEPAGTAALPMWDEADFPPTLLAQAVFRATGEAREESVSEGSALREAAAHLLERLAQQVRAGERAVPGLRLDLSLAATVAAVLTSVLSSNAQDS